MKKIISVFLVFIFIICGYTISLNAQDQTIDTSETEITKIAIVNAIQDLTIGMNKNDISPIEIADESQDMTDEIMDFSFEVLASLSESENILISPLSIISALAMVANGAENETLQQMQEVFGADIGSLNEFLYSYVTNLPTAENYEFSLANSIWIKNDTISPSEEFLQTCKDYYDASVFISDFYSNTVKEVNNWVNTETDGMIEDLLDEIDENTIMLLINALSFEAVWESVYSEFNVMNSVFTDENGYTQQAEFMCDTQYFYIQLDNAIGFEKEFEDGKYSFVALLPDEGVSIEEFISSLDAQAVLSAFDNEIGGVVYTKTPKFTFDYSSSLADVLIEIGMQDAFSFEKADLTGLGEYEENIVISEVIHKTSITVNENGTKAAAVTAEMTAGATAIEPTNIVEIYLNRPFVFMIVDNEFNFPIFVGSLMNV